VLLVFFMLTISVGHLEKELEAANLSGQKQEGPLRMTREQIEQTMLVVKAEMQNNAPVIRVEDQVVDEKDLQATLSRMAGEKRKVELMIEYGQGVRRKTIVAIQDAAAGAGISQIHILTPPEFLGQPAAPPPEP
jgi:biopolymer transport protein ExbD